MPPIPSQRIYFLPVLGLILFFSANILRAEESITRPPETPSLKAAEHFHSGLAHWKTGNREGAILEWQRALEIDPTLSEARFNLDNARRDQQILEQRQSCFESDTTLDCMLSGNRLAKDPPENMIESLDNYHLSLNSHSHDPKSYRMQGDLDSRMNDYAGQVTRLQKYLQQNPNDAMSYYNLGLAYRSLRHYESAVAPLQKAATLNPAMVEAHHALGGVLLQLNMGEKAVHAYQEVVRLRPQTVSSYFNLALAEKSAGNTEEAIEAYLKALSINANDPAIHLNLGAAYDQLGRGPEAIRHTLKAVDLFNQVEQPRKVAQASHNLDYYSQKYNISLPATRY